MRHEIPLESGLVEIKKIFLEEIKKTSGRGGQVKPRENVSNVGNKISSGVCNGEYSCLEYTSAVCKAEMCISFCPQAP